MHGVLRSCTYIEGVQGSIGVVPYRMSEASVLRELFATVLTHTVCLLLDLSRDWGCISLISLIVTDRNRPLFLFVILIFCYIYS